MLPLTPSLIQEKGLKKAAFQEVIFDIFIQKLCSF